MKTLFFLGLGSWIIQILSSGLSFASFNHIKSQINEPASLPLWFQLLARVINLSSVGYLICTLWIFFTFQSPVFMISVILAAVIIAIRMRHGQKVPTKMTKEEIADFNLDFKGILIVWLITLEVFFYGAVPYLLLFIFTL